MGHLYLGHSFNPCPSFLQRMQSHCLSLMTVGIWGNSGQSPSECPRDRQMRQGNRVETLPGEVRGVSSSRCFPLLIILTGSTGDGEGDSVAYAETGLFSSEDEEGGGGEGEEEGGKRSSPSMLWWMSPQSCCAMYSAMNTRGTI